MLLRACLAFLLLAGPASAQGSSAFAATTLPASGPGTVLERGKIIARHTTGSTTVEAFSAFTCSWDEVRLQGPPALLRHANDWALARDGRDWHVFSSLTGRWTKRRLGANATLVNPGSQRNDSLVVVRDGGGVHAFSGPTGRWYDLDVVPDAVAVRRHALVVHAGSTLWGLSALGGGWVRYPGRVAVGTAAADGLAGVFETASAVYGFSASLLTWARDTAPAGTNRAVRGDVALWSGGTEALAFSGLRGTFARAPTGPAAPTQDRQLAVVPAGTRTWLYSAVTGRWSALSTGTPPTVGTDATVALLDEGSTLHAFSAITGSLAPMPGAMSSALSRAVAVATDASGEVHSFSAITGRWHTAPPGTPAALPLLAAQGALITLPGRVLAFDLRRGSFAGVPTQGTVTQHVDSRSAVLAFSDAQGLHAYDARAGRWIRTPLQGSSPPQVVLWRMTLLAVDAGRLVGFGPQAGVFRELPVTGSVTNPVANSESARVRVGSELIAFGPLPEVLTQWQFPAFRRIHTLGAPVRVALRLPPHAVPLVLGFAPGPPAPVVLPGLGELFLGAPAVLLPLEAADVDRGGRLLELGTPHAPALAGSEWWFQALYDGPPQYLSAPATLRIH